MSGEFYPASKMQVTATLSLSEFLDVFMFDPDGSVTFERVAGDGMAEFPVRSRVRFSRGADGSVDVAFLLLTASASGG